MVYCEHHMQLIEGMYLSEHKIQDDITQNINGDCLLVVGEDNLINIYFQTNDLSKY